MGGSELALSRRGDQVLDRLPDSTTLEAKNEDALSQAAVGDAPLEVVDDLLVEEIRIDDLSIDGMCGVY